MGPMLTFHLAGGRGGMAHMLDHFGPALLEPWTRLKAPDLTPALRDAVVAGADEVAAGRGTTELERQRDDFLVDLLRLLADHRSRAGATVAAAVDESPGGGPFTSYAVLVPERWTDYNGHMHDACHVEALSDANELLFAALGLSADYRLESGASFYTVDHHVRYLAECRAGDELTASTLLVQADRKRIRLVTDLVRGDGTVVATGESLYLHVDAADGRVCELSQERWAPVAAMLGAHAALARARADR
jgi:carnitine 3-dehydrogenase